MTDLVPGAALTQVAVEGVRFAVRRADPARRRKTTPALLLHGVPETSAMWRDLLPELAKDRVVIAPDLKGLGGSEPRGPYDLATLVREVAALVMHEVPDGPVDVVGHDWGGVLALGLAEARPDLVRRLCVLNAPYRRMSYLRGAHVLAFSLPVLPELAFRLGGRRLVGAMLRAAWRAEEPLAPELREHYEQSYASPARVEAMLGYYRAAVRPRVRQLLSSGRLPVPPPGAKPERALVLWGAGDPVLPISVGEAAVKDLGRVIDPALVQMVTVPGAGHFVVDEAGEVVVPLVADFLRSP